MKKEVPRSRRFVAALLLVLLTGCQTWQPTTLGARAVLSEEDPTAMRVRRSDGEIVTIKSPVIRNDSIVSAAEGVIEVVGVPMIEINSLEYRRFDGRKTLLFAAGVVALALGWASAVGGNSGGTDPGDPPLPKGPAG